MARVPIMTPGVSQAAAPTPYQRSIATADDFGGLQARAAVQGGQQIAATGDLLGKKALQIQIEDNEREAKKWDVVQAKQDRELGYGDGGENQGYYASRGENAVNGYKDFERGLDDSRRKNAEQITNPRVRQMFETVSSARRERELEQASRHYSAQRRVFNDTVSEARLNEAADDAGTSWNNPKVIGQSIAMVRAEVADMAERNGWAPEVTASKMQEAQTVLHRSVINSALVQDPAAAQAYYAANKDKIDGRVHAEIEKALEAGTMRQQSQAQEDRIMSLGLGESEALKEARAIKDGKLRDETVARVEKRFAEKNRMDIQAEKALVKDSWAGVKQGGSTDDFTPTQLAALPDGALKSMQDFETRRAKNGRGYALAVDPETDNKLHRLFMDDKTAFAEYDMNGVAGKLTEERSNYWTAQQRSIDKKSESETAKAASYALSDKIALQFMHGARWDIGEKGKDSAKAQRVYESARGVVDTLHAEGKRATAEDVTKAMKELFLTGEADGSGFFRDDRGPRAAFLGTDNDGKFILTDIPKQKQQISEVTGVPVEHVENVSKALKAAGVPVTAANIKAAYEKATARGK